MSLAYLKDVCRRFSGNINLDKKIIFIHVPKCAGNSIKKAVGGFSGDSHLKASDIPQGLFDNFFTFSFVRNPWDRCLSAYFYLLKGGSQNRSDLIDKETYVNNYFDFNDFVQNGLLEASKNQQHFKKQCFYLDREVDYIGYFERINQDFNMLSLMLNLQGKLSRQNATKKLNYKKYYNPSSLEIVREIYKDDIDQFGYHSHL